MANVYQSEPCNIFKFGDIEYIRHPVHRNVGYNKNTGKIIVNTDSSKEPWKVPNIYGNGQVCFNNVERKPIRVLYHKLVKEICEHPNWSQKETEGLVFTVNQETIPLEYAPFCPYKFFTWKRADDRKGENSPMGKMIGMVLNTVVNTLAPTTSSAHNPDENLVLKITEPEPEPAANTPEPEPDTDDSSDFTGETYSSIGTADTMKTSRRKGKQFKLKLKKQRELQIALEKKLKLTRRIEEDLRSTQELLKNSEATKDWALDERQRIETIATTLQIEYNRLRRDLQEMKGEFIEE